MAAPDLSAALAALRDRVAGVRLGLVGPNGSGKTTVTNAITGFYPPNKGSIYLDGKDITGTAPHKVATLGVARTFQNLALFNGMSVLENILLGRHIHMKPGVFPTALYWWLARPEEMRNREVVEEVIEFLQLESIRNELVDGIPIGLKKRVELARALVAEPHLLILDEPMAGMNQEEKGYMARFILDARAERGISVLLIEHHMDLGENHGRTLNARQRKELDASEHLEDLKLLRELDDAGRATGVVVEGVDEALAYIKGLEHELYLGE